LTVANNGKDTNGNDVFYKTRIVLDIEGNQRDVIDAKDRMVIRYDYDMLGNRIKQASMEGGTRWILNNVIGKPIRIWGSRGFNRRMTYDSLQRLVELFVTDAASGKEVVAEKTTYGESKQNAELTNHRLKMWELRDKAGVLINENYDFKGNLVQNTRQLLSDYKAQFVDWDQNNPSPPQLETEIFTSRTIYDALNRPIQIIAPHSSRAGTKINVIQPVYNGANLLEKIDAWLQQNTEPSRLFDPSTATSHFVKDIDYNARGQREYIEYGIEDGNSAWTTYEYDEKTFSLVHMQTRRKRSRRTEEELLQDLYYTYDPIGNITHIRDDAQQGLFIKGRWVDPSTDYKYDAVYRLTEAIGREHLGGSNGSANLPEPTSHTDNPRVGLNLNDPNFLGTYHEKYLYDSVGNIERINHEATDPSDPGWIRSYSYEEDSVIELGKKSNRLSSTMVRGTTYSYKHDSHGNMTRIPHFDHRDPDKPDNMHWDFRDQLQKVDLDGGGSTYYIYDAGGQRLRKVHQHKGNVMEERIYLRNFEIYRKRRGQGLPLVLERETLNIMDENQRIAFIESRIHGDDGSPAQLVRYQFSNHLGSSSLELDGQAKIISYEEYYPYGSTSYQAVNKDIELPAKRYRYIDKERDEESGFYCHGMRYYVPWLGRWLSVDPLGLSDGLNMYEYGRTNPIRIKDPSGLAAEDFSDLNDIADDLNKSELKVNLTDTRAPLQPAAKPMSKEEARNYANKQARDYRKSAGMNQGRTVQAGHTAAARHAPESGISKQDWDKQPMQELHSRKGEGLDVTVRDQAKQQKTMSRHLTQEGLINEGVERSRTAGGGKLSPQAQLDAAAEVKWRTENVPMDQRDVDTLRKGGLAKPEKGPPVDPNTGKVIPAGSKAVKPTGLSPSLANSLRNMAGIGRVMNVIGNIVGTVTDLQQIFPEQFVREGKKIELNYTDPKLPILGRPSGYIVEKVDGQIIYRDPNGNQISKEKAQQALDALSAGYI
jgi:RHS repeat-associated protein